MNDSLSKTKCWEVSSYIRGGGRDPETIERLWKRAFGAILFEKGFKDPAVQCCMWDELGQGNWKRLWQYAWEMDRTPEEWLDLFEADVFYCSDRWSLDRLLRCHWMWRQYKEAVRTQTCPHCGKLLQDEPEKMNEGGKDGLQHR